MPIFDPIIFCLTPALTEQLTYRVPCPMGSMKASNSQISYVTVSAGIFKAQSGKSSHLASINFDERWKEKPPSRC